MGGIWRNEIQYSWLDWWICLSRLLPFPRPPHPTSFFHLQSSQGPSLNRSQQVEFGLWVRTSSPASRKSIEFEISIRSLKQWIQCLLKLKPSYLVLLWKNCETDDSCSVGSESLELFRSRFRFRVEHSIRKCLFTFWNFTCLKCNSKSYNLKTELMRINIERIQRFSNWTWLLSLFSHISEKDVLAWKRKWRITDEWAFT